MIPDSPCTSDSAGEQEAERAATPSPKPASDVEGGTAAGVKRKLSGTTPLPTPAAKVLKRSVVPKPKLNDGDDEDVPAVNMQLPRVTSNTAPKKKAIAKGDTK